MIKQTLLALGLGLAISTLGLGLATSTAVRAQTTAPTTTPAPGSPPPAAAMPSPKMDAPSAETPANPDDCLKAAFDLAQAAEDKKLAEDKVELVEELLTKMETHCDARQFNEAMAVGRDIRTMIEK